MKKFRKFLSVVITVALVASINWGYFTQLLTLTKDAAIECVIGGSSAGAALTAELQNISVSKFFDFSVDDFITGIWDYFVSGDDSNEDTGVTEDVVDDSTTKESTEEDYIYIDDAALRHSTVGDFTYDSKTGEVSKMKGGGHGQSNIDFLEEHGFEYNIVKKYSNGVRIGNVPNHKVPSKREGTNQAWFPENWPDSKIKEAGEYIVNLPENKNLPDGVTIYGEYDGVRVGVIKTNGKIGTIFPDANSQP